MYLLFNSAANIQTFHKIQSKKVANFDKIQNKIAQNLTKYRAKIFFTYITALFILFFVYLRQAVLFRRSILKLLIACIRHGASLVC